MRLKDWRGNEYGVGNLVLYPRMSGQSCEIREAVVMGIWNAYYSDGMWKRWNGESPEPTRLEWRRDGKDRYQVEVSALETRVRLRPTGKSSRGFLDRWERERKPVTLMITENITVVTS